jgi:hypothetical protein
MLKETVVDQAFAWRDEENHESSRIAEIQTRHLPVPSQRC